MPRMDAWKSIAPRRLVGSEAACRALVVKDTEAATSPVKVRREYCSMAAILGLDRPARNRDGRLYSLVMKKILNRPLDYVNETLEGLCAAHPNYYRRTGAEGRVMVRPDAPIQGKVGIVTGGGSGHLPVFTGYLGPGLLDACAIGEVFSSPGVDLMADAIRAANGGAGVLRLYGNYGGDSMNFDMAGEFAEMEGIPTTTVKVADDMASASLKERSKRRGIAGLVYC